MKIGGEKFDVWGKDLEICIPTHLVDGGWRGRAVSYGDKDDRMN